MRKRRARRMAVGVRAPILVEARPNARWSTDFVHDQFANGRRLRPQKPGMIVSDHGTEFTCNAMLTWCRDNGIDWHFIAPGKPIQKTLLDENSVVGQPRDQVSFGWEDVLP